MPDMTKISNTEFEDMFESSFEAQVGSNNDITEFDVVCERSVDTESVTMVVNIFGMAGTPTIDDFKEGRIEGAESLTIERADIGSMQFKLIPEKTAFLNANDYQVVYQSV